MDRHFALVGVGGGPEVSGQPLIIAGTDARVTEGLEAALGSIRVRSKPPDLALDRALAQRANAIVGSGTDLP